MNPALLYLSYRSLRGQIAGWLRLMRQPKYLLGLLVGLAYFWFFALRFFLRAGNRTRWMDSTLKGYHRLPAAVPPVGCLVHRGDGLRLVAFPLRQVIPST